MDKLMEILADCCPGVDFDKETALIDDGLLTSLDVVMIVGELNDAFGVDITVDDLEPVNFNSARAIGDLVRRLGGSL